MSNVAIFVAHEGCPQCCAFCNQHIIAGQTRRTTAAEVTAVLQKALENPRHGEHQIAFFGGSFTAIEREYMLELLEACVPFQQHFRGIRISTRPDAIDDDILRILRQYGVTAIELGAQSMDNEVLSLNRRGHTAEDVQTAARRIRNAGFELGVQMMTGLYGDTDETAIATAKALIALAPDTVRIYPTVVLQGTELERLYRAGKFVPQTLEEAICLCVKLIPLFENAGIRIIRVGLHESEAVKTARVAGAYHPAFKELCLSRIYFEAAREALAGKPQGHYRLFVRAKSLSQMIGQNKENVRRLAAAGYHISVVADDSLGSGEIRVEQETNSCI